MRNSIGVRIPAGAPKNLPRLSAGDIFSGRSRGVEVYPRQGKSPLEHQKISLAFRRGIFFPVAPGESKFIPGRGNPRWSTKKYPSPFGGGYFFRSLPGSRSLSPIGEIPAGAPKNLLAFWRGDFFWPLPGSRSLSPIGEIPAGAPKNLLAFWRGDFFRSLPGSRSLSPSGEIPAGAPKNIPRLSAGDIFSGRSRGVEVYPR